MLLVQRNARLGSSDDRRSASHPATTIKLRDIWHFVCRQRVVIAGVATIWILLATAYILVSVPRFTAEAFVLVDPTKARQYETRAPTSETVVESALVDSQVEIARSGRVVLRVIRDLKLDGDPELSTAVPSLTGTLLSLLSRLRSASGDWGVPAAPPSLRSELLSLLRPASEAESNRASGGMSGHAVEAFRRNLSVRRLGLTYVLQISFTSQDRKKAALIANQVALAYVNDGLEAKYDDVKLAEEWLEKRSEELRTQALAAERAAQRFRTEHRIVETERGPVDEQQLSELNSQLVLARAHTAEDQARLDYIEGIIRKQDAEAVVMDALRNDVISRLRSRMLDAKQAESELTRRFGEGQGTAVQLHEEVEGLKRSIFDELKRIAEGYRSDYEVAKSRENSLAASLKELVSRNLATDESRVMLHELERDAQTSRTVYEAFLTRRKEAAQQQSFPIAEARIITAAEPPNIRSYPRTTLILGAALCFGALAGVAAGLMRDNMDRTFRTAQQAERETGLNCLAMVPRVAGKLIEARKTLHGDISGAGHALRRYAVQEPCAALSDVMRSVKVALDAARSECKIRVVGVVSTLRHEGSTTIAGALAHVTAEAGHRVLLIHADLRKCAAVGTDVDSPQRGLGDVILGGHRLQDVVLHDPDTSLSVLGAGSLAVANPTPVVASPEMRELLEHETNGYDLIILDLPPLTAAVDGRAIAPIVDAFVLVIAWGQTPRDIVLRAISGADMVYQRTLGCILNRVDVKAMRRFDRDGAGYHHLAFA
jgi:succinoglycan biosynthesis transport protein ExoP